MSPYIEVCIDPDGVNGDVWVTGDYDGPEVRVIVTRGIEREVIHDTHPDVTCRHCQRTIVQEDGAWIDPEATGDDSIWRETCDAHDTFEAEHEPDDEEGDE